MKRGCEYAPLGPSTSLRIMLSLAKLTDRSAHASLFYYGIFKNLVRHSNVQALLPEKDRRRITLAYYESIKGLSHTKMQPLFWLQYAIACLFYEEFERAEKYFETAYALGKDLPYWDTFQIDNHFARFLLTRATSLGDASSCMTAFRGARKIIHNQIETEKERLHYPFRVASLYGDFYERFARVLKPQHKEEIKRAVKHVCDRIEKLPPERQDQRYVHECWEKLEKVLESTI